MTSTASRVAPLAHPRITGLDVARAIALLGMFAAHVGNAGEYGPGGWRWLIVAHGRASALFTVLAGVSIALMLVRKAAPGDPAEDRAAVRHTRIRVAVRAVLLLVLGWVLALLATPVDVILDNLGVMFLFALVAMRWRPLVLIGVGAAVLAFGRPLVDGLVDVMPRWLYDMPVLHELWGVHYPALIWIGYVLVGMGIGRLAPWRGSALASLAVLGAAMAAVAYGVPVALKLLYGTPILWADPGGAPRSWLDVYAHSYTAFETLGNVGVAFLAIAACCWLAHVLPRVTWPLAATGSMTLTLYSAHIVLIAIVGRDIVFDPSNLNYVALCLASIAFASVWRWKLGQGPLERAFTTLSTGIADDDARRAHVGAPA